MPIGVVQEILTAKIRNQRKRKYLRQLRFVKGNDAFPLNLSQSLVDAFYWECNGYKWSRKWSKLYDTLMSEADKKRGID
jgi:hypothetical protein